MNRKWIANGQTNDRQWIDNGQTMDRQWIYNEYKINRQSMKIEKKRDIQEEGIKNTLTRDNDSKQQMSFLAFF